MRITYEESDFSDALSVETILALKEPTFVKACLVSASGEQVWVASQATGLLSLYVLATTKSNTGSVTKKSSGPRSDHQSRRPSSWRCTSTKRRKTRKSVKG